MSEGKAFMNGYVSKKMNLVRRTIELVPQDLTLDRDMAGRNHLRIQTKMYDVPETDSKRKHEELPKLVNLQDVEGREVSTYS